MATTYPYNPPLTMTIDLGFGKGVAAHLVRSVQSGIERGCSTFRLRTTGNAALSPDCCASVAGVISHFTKNHGCRFTTSIGTASSRRIASLGLIRPFTDPDSIEREGSLGKVWEFKADTHYGIVSGIVSALRQETELSGGVLNSIELCLNEVSDNVLVHSLPDESDPSGFMMAQSYDDGRYVAVAVYDNGIGIPASLARAGFQVADARDAITFALRRGVTDGRGAGNGLWLLDSIVRQGQGSFVVVSEGARYSLWHPDASVEARPRASFSKALTLSEGTTLVNFRLNASRPIDLERVMGPGGGVNLWAENREDKLDERNIRLNVAREAPGLGSRRDGARFRTLALNAAADTTGLVVLDFSEVNVLSMSFADEVVRKLYDKLGSRGFAERFRLDNLNETCRQVICGVMGDRV